MQDLNKVVMSAKCLHDQSSVEFAIQRMAKEIHAKLHDADPIILCLMTGGVVVCGQLLTQLRFPLELDYIHCTRYQNALRVVIPNGVRSQNLI